MRPGKMSILSIKETAFAAAWWFWLPVFLKMDDSAGKRKRSSPIQAARMRARIVEHETGCSDELLRRCILKGMLLWVGGIE